MQRDGSAKTLIVAVLAFLAGVVGTSVAWKFHGRSVPPEGGPDSRAVIGTVRHEPNDIASNVAKSQSKSRPYKRSVADYPLPDVSLVDASGCTLSLKDALLGDGPVVMQFVFTSCPTICPVMAGSFARLQDRLGEDLAQVRLVSISIDPEHDTPRRLQQFGRAFGASPRWSLYTGTRTDIHAVQKAFNAYDGNKMYHQPLTFMRESWGRPWVRINGLLSGDELLTECRHLLNKTSTSIGNAELGRRIYQQGTLPSGEPLHGVTQGDIEIVGEHLKCANCHRKSGFASAELATYVPPVTAPALYQPRDVPSPNLIRKMFQEVHPKQTHARVRDPRVRPAYRDETLATALRQGIDPAGRQLDRLMPRYQLSDENMLHLIAYLKTLATEEVPGVEETRIHFATVITPGADPRKRDAMQAVIDAYVRRKNVDTQYKLKNPDFSPQFKSDFLGAFRQWVVHPWQLEDSAETWKNQLHAYYRRQPVFAMISGISGPESWQPVHEFCEHEQLPCLFPHTDLPGKRAAGGYSLYLSKGLVLEAEVVASHLRRRQSDIGQGAGETMEIVQIYRDTECGTSLAQAFFSSHGEAGRLRVRSCVVPAGRRLDANVWHELMPPGHKPPAALVLWLNREDLSRLGLPPEQLLDGVRHVFLSYTMLGGDPPPALIQMSPRIHIVYPYALPGRETPRIYRVRAWLRSRGIRRSHERIQLNTFFALSITNHALMHLVEDYSRDYLIESIEHETENSLNPGTYPHLSLGPGQRFASKGARLVKLSSDGRIEASSDWIVPVGIGQNSGVGR